MFGWLRRIRRVNIFGFEIEFDHPAPTPTDVDEGHDTVPPTPPISTPSPPPVVPAPHRTKREDRPSPPPPVVTAPPTTKREDLPSPPPQFTVHGEVIKTVGKDLGIRVENEEELRKFWKDHQIDTQLDWFDRGAPVCSIGRQEDVARCKPGDRASLSFVVQDRKDGKRGIRTIAFDVVSRG